VKIKLTQDIIEYDRHGESVGIKTNKKRNPKWGPSQVVYGKLVESDELQFIMTPWTKGTVIEMSEASGQKYITAGKGTLED
jgi:hypothetical protein